jgi:hypothetical protein
VDFQVLLLGRSRGPGEVAGPLDVLFAETLAGMRGGQPTMGRREVATVSLPVTIVAEGGP